MMRAPASRSPGTNTRRPNPHLSRSVQLSLTNRSVVVYPTCRLTAGLAALSDPDFDPLTNGREALGLPLSAVSVEEMADPAFLERLFQWRSLVAITRVGAPNTAP